MGDYFLFELGTVLTLAFFAATLVKKIGLSVLIGYVVVGLLIGPYGIGIVQDVHVLESFSEMGVVLLMFFLGIEFSIDKFKKIRKTVVFIGTYEVIFNLVGGLLLSLLVGLFVGYSFREKLFFACIVALSSSGVVAKLLFDLKRTANPETEILMGVMIFEDFFAVVLLGILGSLATSGTVNPLEIVVLLLKVALFFTVFLLIGKFIITKLIDYLTAISSQELFTALVIGLVLLSGALADIIGLSAAAGAFLLGMIVTSFDVEQRLHRTVGAFKDIFLTVFFISFGMLLDLRTLPNVIGIVLIAIVASIIMEIVVSSSASYISGFSSKKSIMIGTSMIPRGEYSLIFANIGLAAGAISNSLYQFTGLYVLAMIFIAPFFMKNHDKIHKAVEKVTPQFVKKSMKWFLQRQSNPLE